MIECLEIKGEEDFTLDFKKFKSKLNDLGNISMSNHEVSTVRVKQDLKQQKFNHAVVRIQARVRGFLVRR